MYFHLKKTGELVRVLPAEEIPTARRDALNEDGVCVRVELGVRAGREFPVFRSSLVPVGPSTPLSLSEKRHVWAAYKDMRTFQHAYDTLRTARGGTVPPGWTAALQEMPRAPVDPPAPPTALDAARRADVSARLTCAVRAALGLSPSPAAASEQTVPGVLRPAFIIVKDTLPVKSAAAAPEPSEIRLEIEEPGCPRHTAIDFICRVDDVHVVDAPLTIPQGAELRAAYPAARGIPSPTHDIVGARALFVWIRDACRDMEWQDDFVYQDIGIDSIQKHPDNTYTVRFLY